VKIDRDRLSKNIWLIIGICVLIWGGYRSARWAFDGIWKWTHPYDYRPTGVPSDNTTKVNGADTLVKSQVEIKNPRAIPGTDWLVYDVLAQDQESFSAKYSTPALKEMMGVQIDPSLVEHQSNLLFTNSKTGQSHLLIDRRAYINSVFLPSGARPSEGTSNLRSVCLFGITFDDTDGDSLLSSKDKSTWWLSDLDGRNLTMIADTSEAFVEISEVNNVIYVGKRASSKHVTDVPSRVWIFNKNTRSLERIPAIDSLMPRLESILWGQ